MHAAGEIEFDLGAGPGDPGGALEFDRQQRVGSWRRRPAIVVHAHHPEGVESQAGALEQAQYLQLRVAARLGLEQALAGEFAQAPERLAGRVARMGGT